MIVSVCKHCDQAIERAASETRWALIATGLERTSCSARWGYLGHEPLEAAS